MKLPAALDTALQVFGLRKTDVTNYDMPLLQKALVGVDYLGRTNPIQYTGGTVNWLSVEQAGIRRHLVGQIGRVNNFFATKAAALPWVLYKPSAEGKKEPVTKSGLLDLLWQPNAQTSQVAFMRQVATLYKGAGDVFVWANRLDSGINRGKPKELWLLPKHHMEVVGGGPMEEVQKYYFTPDLSKPNDRIELLKEDVLHLKHDALPGEKYGVSVIVSANREATADQASISAQVSQMQNQGPAGVLSFEPVEGKPVQLGPGVVEDMRRRLGRDYSGPDSRGKVPIMTQAVKWTAIGTNAVDLDIIEFRKANFREICSWWGVPSVLLGDMEASTDNNYQNSRKAFYTDGILPYLDAILPEFSTWLCPMFEKGTWLEYDLSGVPELQEDKAAQVAWLKDAYWITTQRKQEIIGEEPDETLPKYLIPAGLVSVDELMAGDEEAALKLLGRHNVNDYK